MKSFLVSTSKKVDFKSNLFYFSISFTRSNKIIWLAAPANYFKLWFGQQDVLISKNHAIDGKMFVL